MYITRVTSILSSYVQPLKRRFCLSYTPSMHELRLARLTRLHNHTCVVLVNMQNDSIAALGGSAGGSDAVATD